MYVVGPSETLVPVCQSAWQDIPKDDVHHSRRLESSAFHLNSPGLSHHATEHIQNVSILYNLTTTLSFIQHIVQEAEPHNTGLCKNVACSTCTAVSKNENIRPQTPLSMPKLHSENFCSTHFSIL